MNNEQQLLSLYPTQFLQLSQKLEDSLGMQHNIFQYAMIAIHLTELLKKNDEASIWISACTHVINTLK